MGSEYGSDDGGGGGMEYDDEPDMYEQEEEEVDFQENNLDMNGTHHPAGHVEVLSNGNKSTK